MTSETWFECPLRSGLSTWILSWVTPVKASGSPETRNASGVKQSLSWLFFEYLHLLTQNDEHLQSFGTQMFHVFFRWSGESAFFEIRQLRKDIWYMYESKANIRPAPGAKAWSIQNEIVSSFWYRGGGQSFGQYISMFSTDLAWAKPKPSLVRAFLRTAN